MIETTDEGHLNHPLPWVITKVKMVEVDRLYYDKSVGDRVACNFANGDLEAG